MRERERETIWDHNLSLENIYDEFKTSSGFFVLSSSHLRYVGFPPIIGKAITSGTLKSKWKNEISCTSYKKKIGQKTCSKIFKCFTVIIIIQRDLLIFMVFDNMLG